MNPVGNEYQLKNLYESLNYARKKRNQLADLWQREKCNRPKWELQGKIQAKLIKMIEREIEKINKNGAAETKTQFAEKLFGGKNEDNNQS